MTHASPPPPPDFGVEQNDRDELQRMNDTLPPAERITTPPPASDASPTHDVLRLSEEIAGVMLAIRGIEERQIEERAIGLERDRKLDEIQLTNKKILKLLQRLGDDIFDFRQESTEQHSDVGTRVSTLEAEVTLAGKAIIDLEKRVGLWPVNGNGNGNGHMPGEPQ